MPQGNEVALGCDVGAGSSRGSEDQREKPGEDNGRETEGDVTLCSRHRH